MKEGNEFDLTTVQVGDVVKYVYINYRGLYIETGVVKEPNNLIDFVQLHRDGCKYIVNKGTVVGILREGVLIYRDMDIPEEDLQH